MCFLHKCFCFQLQLWDKGFCLSLMLYVKYWRKNYLVSSCFLSKQQVQDFALNKLHISKFLKTKWRVEDWAADQMEEGVGGVEMLHDVYFLSFFLFIYLFILMSKFNHLQSFSWKFFDLFLHHCSQDHHHFAWWFHLTLCSNFLPLIQCGLANVLHQW